MKNMIRTVIVAEDDPILREILLDKLNKSGLRALGASDGTNALELIRTERPSVVLLDIILPVKNGLEVLREMKANMETKDIPVIILSNSDNADAIREAKQLGVHDFLIKAIFDSNDVVDRVQKIIGGLPTKDLSTPAVVSNNPPPTAKTIILVEDDRFLREIATQKLEVEGFRVIVATTGNEALEYLAKNPRPNLIVLDLILPGMSGFEVLEKVKQDQNLKSIPVLILSNLGQEEDIEKGKKLGATDYLVKAHFSFAEITKKIKEIVG